MRMNFVSKMKSTISFLLSGTLMISAAFTIQPTNAGASDTCVIDASTEYQVIKGFGGMNHPEWTGQDLTEVQRQTAFGNGDEELGMSIVRIYVNDDPNQWYRTLATAQDVTARGGIVFATPWNPPSDMCETFTRTYTTWDGKTATQENQKRLRHDKYAEYAQHLNNFVHYMKENGVDLYCISIQNEPDYGEDWTWMTSDECVDFLENYADQIDCPVMSPESFSYNKEYYTKILNNSKAYANTDIFGTHFYGTSRSNMDFPQLENCGKEIFMTEVYVPNSDADSSDRWPESIQVAENIHNGLVVGNMNAYVWWYIRRSYGPMKEDGTISKRGYCMAQYSKFVRPGDVRIEATEQPADNVYVSAYKNDENQITIVAVNKGTEGYTQNFSIDGDEAIGSVERYRTSASESLAYTANLEAAENSFWAQLPAESVSTFVVSLKEGPNDFGWYFDNGFESDTEGWTSRGAATIAVSSQTAYMGSQSLFISGRTAAWNGAQKALDTAAFKPGTEYSFSANVIYTSGEITDTFYMKLQYVDGNGDTRYATIAEATAIMGEWVQLANSNFKIPSDASNMHLYIETADSTNSFYLDEAIGAVGGTGILGAGSQKIILGDVNSDGVIDTFDLALAKKGYTNGFNSTAAQAAADVDRSGVFDETDLVLIQDFLLARITEFPTAEKPYKPEVVIDPEIYMNNVRNLMSEYALSGCTEEYSWVEYGTLTKYQYYSTTRERMTNVNVLLPPGYTPNETYPVLYALHGYWETEDTLAEMGQVRNMLGNLISTGDAKKMIVVFPYIYTSKTQESCSGLDLANSLNYDNFINDLTTDLMPFIEKTFSVKTGRANTAITGFSMGGRESLFIGLTHSDLFGYVGAVCPAPGLTPGYDSSIHPGQIQESQMKPYYNNPYLIMITGGGNDGVVGTQPSVYHDILTNNGIDHVWHYVTTGEHNATSVQPHLYNYLRAIFQAE